VGKKINNLRDSFLWFKSKLLQYEANSPHPEERCNVFKDLPQHCKVKCLQFRSSRLIQNLQQVKVIEKNLFMESLEAQLTIFQR
jgi:hypothetical protein